MGASGARAVDGGENRGTAPDEAGAGAEPAFLRALPTGPPARPGLRADPAPARRRPARPRRSAAVGRRGLARAFGVSRPIVRTALARLRADGLIAFAPRAPAASWCARSRRISSRRRRAAASPSCFAATRCASRSRARPPSSPPSVAPRAISPPSRSRRRGSRREFDGPDSGAAADVAFHRAIAHRDAEPPVLAHDGDAALAAARRHRHRAPARPEERRPAPGRSCSTSTAAVLDAIRAGDGARAREAMRNAHFPARRDRMLGFQL